MRVTSRVVLSAVLPALVLGAPCLGHAAPEPAKETIRVFVHPRDVPELTNDEEKRLEKQAKAERKRAEKERKAVHDALKKQYGGDEDDWPAEALEEAAAARRAEMMAIVAHHEIKEKPKVVEDSASDLIEALENRLGDVSHVALVAAAEKADLVVEVLTRRGKASFPAAEYIIYVKVSPVGWEDPVEAFSATPFSHFQSREAYFGGLWAVRNVQGKVWTLHHYSEDEPYWVLEAYQQGASWRGPAYTLADVLVELSADLVAPEEGALQAADAGS